MHRSQTPQSVLIPLLGRAVRQIGPAGDIADREDAGHVRLQLRIDGDVTDQILLWDAGTEVNMYPGTGADQAPRQSGADTGAAENGVVEIVNDGFSYPSDADAIRITISAQ